MLSRRNRVGLLFQSFEFYSLILNELFDTMWIFFFFGFCYIILYWKLETDYPMRDGSRCNYVKYTSFPISFDLYFILFITKERLSCKMMFLTVQTTDNRLNYNLWRLGSYSTNTITFLMMPTNRYSSIHMLMTKNPIWCQYSIVNMIIFIFKKKRFFRAQKNIPKPNCFKIKKNCSHADKICPDSKSKHLGDREYRFRSVDFMQWLRSWQNPFPPVCCNPVTRSNPSLYKRPTVEQEEPLFL